MMNMPLSKNNQIKKTKLYVLFTSNHLEAHIYRFTCWKNYNFFMNGLSKNIHNKMKKND